MTTWLSQDAYDRLTNEYEELTTTRRAEWRKNCWAKRRADTQCSSPDSALKRSSTRP